MISQNEFISSVRKKAINRKDFVEPVVKIIASLFPIQYNLSNKKVKDFKYITICPKKSFQMVKYSINSFINNSDLIPNEVVIISDGSWDVCDGNNYFAEMGLNIKLESWKSSADYHKKLARIDLYIWAKKHIWGKKMSAILRHTEESLVLFADPDVLWFKTPIQLQDFSKKLLLKISMDNSHNYDTELIKKFNLQFLFAMPPINCGIILAKGDLYDNSSQIIKMAIRHESTNPGKFAEQTIFALMIHEIGELWTNDEITSRIDDVISPIFRRSCYSKVLIARHYVWAMSWMYWRDLILKPIIK